MTMPTSSCPDINLLRRYLRGQLQRAIAENIEQHILACGRCTEQLNTALANTLPHSFHGPLRAIGSTGGSAANLDFSVDSPAEGGGDEPTQHIPPNFDPEIANQDAANAAAVHAAYAANPFLRFQLLECIGEGGMGAVYRAYDQQLKRTVAIKMLTTLQADSQSAQQRLHTEAVALARVEHTNIVPLLESYPASDPPFLALEYLGGGSLADRFSLLQPPPELAADLLILVAKAIHAAHQQGVVHRDLKPANILLTGDRHKDAATGVPKVIDFSIARFIPTNTAASTPAPTGSGDSVQGTPSYMAPEQARGDANIGPAADVYGLGATLYDLLCGRPPFRGTTLEEVCQRVIEQDPIPPRQLNANVPRDLETICLKCLAKDPAHRYESALAFADDLERFRRRESILAKRTNVAVRALKWVQRHRLRTAGATLFVLVISTVVALAFMVTKRLAEERREQDRLTTERMAADDLRFANEYHRLLKQARNRAMNPRPGWRWDGLNDVETAAAIATPSRDITELRSITADLLGRTDIREAEVFAKNFNTWAIAFHPAKNWIILGEGRGGFAVPELKIEIRDGTTGTLVHMRSIPHNVVIKEGKPREDRLRMVALSPDGRWLVAGTRHGRLHRWDLTDAKGTIHSEVFGPESECNSVVFTPDGTKLFAGVTHAKASRVIAWETRTWQRSGQRELPRTHTVLGMRPDGKALYCTDAHGSVRELDPNDLAAERGTFATDESGTFALAADGRLLATTRNRRLHLWDTKTRTLACVLREPHREHAFPTDVQSVCFSPDRRLLAASDEFRRQVYLYDLVTRERIAQWPSDGEGPHPIAFHPNGRWLLVGGAHGTTFLEIGGQQELRRLAPQAHPVLGAAIHHDGSHLAACYACPESGKPYVDGAIWRLDAPLGGAGPKIVWQGDLGAGQAGHVQTRADGVTAFVVAGQVRVVNPKAMPPLLLETQVNHADQGFFGPDQRLWLTNGPQLEGYPLTAKQPPLRYSNKSDALKTGRAALTAFVAGKQHSLIGVLDGSVRLFETPTPLTVHFPELAKSVYPKARDDVRSLALTPDETQVVCGTESGMAFVLKVPTLTTQASWQAHEQSVQHVAFLSPTLFATGGADRLVRFWRWTNGTAQLEWEQRLTGAITSLNATADGRQLCVTADGERGVHIWDLQALNERFRPLGIAFEW